MEVDAKAAVPSLTGSQAAAQMTYAEFLRRNPKIGYLKVQASRARQALPAAGVRIFIVQNFQDARVLFFDGQTNADGVTEPIALPAPPLAGSLDAQNPAPGAVYQVYASRPGFKPQRYEIEIFEDVTAILPVTLLLTEE